VNVSAGIGYANSTNPVSMCQLLTFGQ